MDGAGMNETSSTPTEGGDATTTPEGSEGWVDPAGSPQSGQAVTASDVTPDESPEASEHGSRASEQESGGEASNAPSEFDAEAHEAESAEHDKFLETYQPCITRLPEALADERAAYDKEVTEARVQTLVTELGISEDEARESVYGSTPSGEGEPEPTSEAPASTA